MERRALYHSLRVNWQLDPTLKVKPWQVEDYRMVPSAELFSRLEKLGISIDYGHFVSLSESQDTPEELAETLLPDDVEDQEIADQIYLIVFELWRRFLSERQTLSLICDEWDHQIDLYEAGQPESLEGLGDMIGRFITLLEETKDQNEDPQMLYDSVLQNCAHDIEGFLYDFALAQIEEQNISYASDIVEAFLPLSKEKIWFQLLNAEILGHSEKESSQPVIHQLLKDSLSRGDLEFNLEFLAYLAQKGEERSFFTLVKQTLPLLTIEEEFWDLLASCEDFFHFKDAEDQEGWVKALRHKRFKNDPEKPLNSQDLDLKELQKLLFN